MAGKAPIALPPKPEELGYIDFPSLRAEYGKQEGFKEKLFRKMKENPFVPLGLGVTVFALSYGLWQLKTGDRAMSQKMMRLRVAAQGFTVVALLGGVLYSSHKSKQKRLEEQSLVQESK